MSLPSKVKTWQYSNNNAQGNTGTLLGDARATMRQLKNSLITFGTLPWTVRGSSNSVASGMDLTDRWSSDANLVFAAGAHSWIVLRQTGISAKFEFCIDLNNATQSNATVVVSGAAGFGTANGGTDGSTSARPTATDEIVLLAAATWNGNPGVTSLFQVHVQQSTDGECTRIYVTQSQVCVTFAVFDKPQNPISAWSSPWFATFRGATTVTTSCALFTQLNDNSIASFKPQSGVVAGNLYFATTFMNSGAAVGQRISVPHDVSGGRPFTPITLVSDTPGVRGVWGEVYDMYFCDDQLTKATQFDSSPSRQWTYMKDVVVPWDGSTQVAS